MGNLRENGVLLSSSRRGPCALLCATSASDVAQQHVSMLDSSDKKSAALEKEAESIAQDELKEASQMSKGPGESPFGKQAQVEEEPIMRRYQDDADVATQKLQDHVKAIHRESDAASVDLDARAKRAVMALYSREVERNSMHHQ